MEYQITYKITSAFRAQVDAISKEEALETFREWEFLNILDIDHIEHDEIDVVEVKEVEEGKEENCMLTQQHYMLIAKTLKEAKVDIPIIEVFVEAFKKDNPSFKSDMFREASFE